MRCTPRTILGQAIAGTVIVQLLVFAVFTTLSVRSEVHDARERERQRLQNQSHIIVNVLDEPLYTGNRDMFDHIMHALPITTSIRGVLVTDVDGKTLGVSSRAIPAELAEAERAQIGALLVSPGYRLFRAPDGSDEGVQPVVVGGRVLGFVWIHPDGVLFTRSLRSLLGNILLYAVCALVGNMLLLWVLSGSIARPLGRLRRAAQQVQRTPDDLGAFPLSVIENNEAGDLTAAVNAMVSEIAQQRRGIQDTLNLLDSMLSSAPIGFGFYDREYRYVRLNAELAHMHGVPLEKHIGRRLRDLVPAGAEQSVAGQAERLIEAVFKTRKPLPEEEISGILPGDAAQRTWQVSYFPVLVGDGDVRWVGVIATDITARKRSEQAMRRSERLAAAGRLATSIAHEISNPLESISNLLYLLRNDATLGAQAQDYVGLAQEELARVGEVAQQTLRFYRQSSTASDVKFSEVVRSVLALHTSRLRSSGVEADIRVDDAIVMFGYAGELRQLFANLVGNAIEAMPHGGRLILRAHFDRSRDISGLRVIVADTGTGMPAAVLQRIFEPFFTTKEATGTGLGLWVSEEILHKHGATMQVRSREARYPGDLSGTVFRIFFPWRGVPRGPVAVHSAAQVLADHLV